MYIVYNKNNWNENTTVYDNSSMSVGEADYQRVRDKENIVVVVNISNCCLVSEIIEQIKDIPRRVERAEKILKSMNEKELYEAFGDFGNKDDFLDNEYGIWRYFELGEIEDIIKDVFNERNMVGKGEE